MVKWVVNRVPMTTHSFMVVYGVSRRSFILIASLSRHGFSLINDSGPMPPPLVPLPCAREGGRDVEY